MAKTIFPSVAWFRRYKTLKSVPVGSGRVGSGWSGRSVGSLKLRKFSYSAKTRSAFGLARNKHRPKINGNLSAQPLHVVRWMSSNRSNSSDGSVTCKRCSDLIMCKCECVHFLNWLVFLLLVLTYVFFISLISMYVYVIFHWRWSLDDWNRYGRINHLIHD